MEMKYTKNIVCCVMFAAASPMCAVPMGLSFSSDIDRILTDVVACMSSGEEAVNRFLDPSNNESFAVHLANLNQQKAALEQLEADCKKSLLKNSSGPKAEALKAAGEFVHVQLGIARSLVSTVEANRKSKAIMFGLRLRRLMKEAEKEYATMQGCISRMKIALGQVAPDKVGKVAAVAAKLTQMRSGEGQISEKRALEALGKRVACCGLMAPVRKKQEKRLVLVMLKEFACLGRDRALALAKASLHHLHIRRLAERAR